MTTPWVERAEATLVAALDNLRNQTAPLAAEHATTPVHYDTEAARRTRDFLMMAKVGIEQEKNLRGVGASAW